MIITIDGPAGAGKSSISKMVAQQLGFEVLDTGAMYRAFAYLLKKNNIALDDPSFSDFLNDFTMFFENGRVIANNIDVTDYIRTPEIDVFSSSISSNEYVRLKMKDLQRKAAQNKNIIAEGRDMGSNVFPNAEIKIYLDASVSLRAKRRYEELLIKGIQKGLDELEEEMILRDKDDTSRKFSPLCIPENSVTIDTSNLNQQEVVQKILNLFNNTNKTSN